MPSHFLNTSYIHFSATVFLFPAYPPSLYVFASPLRFSWPTPHLDSSNHSLYHLPPRTLPSLPHSLPLPFPPSLTSFLEGGGTPTTAWAFKHIGLKVVREACGENGDESLSLSVEHCVQACRRCGRAWEASFTIRIEIRRWNKAAIRFFTHARNVTLYIY